MLRTRVVVIAVGVALVVSGAGCSTDEEKAPAASTFDITGLDKDASPCDNFDAFVNAKWDKATEIPSDQSSSGINDQLTDESLDVQRSIAESAAGELDTLDKGTDRYKIGALYKSATDESAINARGFDPIKPDLAAIDALKSKDDVVKFLNDDAVNGGGILYGVFSGADYKDATKQIAFIGTGGVNLPSKEYYTDPSHASVVTAYRAYLERGLQLVGAGDPAGQAAQAYDFEQQLAAASLAPEDQRKPENQYHPVTVAEANAVTPAFDWGAYLTQEGVRTDVPFSLGEPDFFRKFDQLLTTAPIAQWQAYLRTQVVINSAARLSQDFRDARFEFNKVLSGTTTQPPRWKVGISAVNSAMGEAMGKLYVERKFDDKAKERAMDLVRHVLDALKARIERADWMSADTKAKALEKWQAILPKIGYPDTWRDWDGLSVDPGKYFENARAADKFNHAYEVSHIGKPSDRKQWHMLPQTVNAYYSATDNTINFPAAILQPPNFDPNADDTLNYGNIGATIGHEATHAFDDQGSQFDANGNNVQWWTEQDRANFEARAQKLVDQFDAYVPIPSKPDLHVNGELTLGENIADLGGLEAAFDAFNALGETDTIDGYTPQQRFFISYAESWREKIRPESLETQVESDPHAPAFLRVNGVVRNVDGFATAFGCPAVPDRAQVW